MIAECPGCHARYDVTGRTAGTMARCRCGTRFAVPDAPKVAGSLSCPKCGAAADPDKRACTYCSAVLAPLACPSCFGMMFAGHRHCPNCGARADVAARSPDSVKSARRCPRCPSRPALFANLTGDVMLDQCEGCGGMYVDRETLERLMADRDRQAGLHKALGGDTATAVPGAQEVRYLPCPQCNTIMMRQNFGRCSGVIVDVCKGHGTWFDAEELRRIIQFAQTGGLEKARQREIEELDRAIAAKRNKLEGGPAMMPVHGSARYDVDVASDVVSAILNALF